MSDNIHIQANNGAYRLIAEQTLYCKSKDLWSFISSPKNLSLITPENLKFDVLNTKISHKIYDGMEISYQVSPFLGYAVGWKSRIEGIKEGEEFTDVQIEGPFTLWKHRHLIEKSGKNELIMYDYIDYELPLGKIGQLIGDFPVKKRLREIFEYRREKLDLFFNAPGKLNHLASSSAVI